MQLVPLLKLFSSGDTIYPAGLAVFNFTCMCGLTVSTELCVCVT